MLKHWNGISEWVNQPVQMKANQKRNRKIKWFFCTFPEGGKSIIRPFSRKKGGKEAENNFPTFFPEKGRKIDFPTGRKAEGGGRFLPEANLIAPFIKLLYLIYGNSMSRGDKKKITQCVWQMKSIFSTQKNFQRHYMMLRCIFGINHFSFLRIWDLIFLPILAQLCLVSPWDRI